MCDVYYAPTFVRMYKKLPRVLQEEVKEKISQFESEENDDALRIHGLSGKLSYCSAFSVNYKTRIVFKADEKDEKKCYLFLVGSHDEVYK